MKVTICTPTPPAEANHSFISDVVYTDKRLQLWKVRCLCGCVYTFETTAQTAKGIRTARTLAHHRAHRWHEIRKEST